MKSGILKYSFILLLLIFHACNHDIIVIESPGIQIPLSGNALCWMNYWEDTSFSIKTWSNNGLTDSFTIEVSEDYVEEYPNSHDHNYQIKRYSYNSAKYGFDFILGVSAEGILPNTFYSVELNYRNSILDFQNPSNFLIHYDTIDYPSWLTEIFYDYYSKTISFDSQVSFIGEFISNNRTYTDVYRYYNSFVESKGQKSDVFEVYFDKNFGILEFRLRNGTNWFLDLSN
jgi:hypothetical protein